MPNVKTINNKQMPLPIIINKCTPTSPSEMNWQRESVTGLGFQGVPA